MILALLKNFKLKNAFRCFGFIAIILTLLPLAAADYWWIRIFDFPHLQLTLLTTIAIISYLIKFDFKDYKDYLFVAVLSVCVFYQGYKLYPYTTFADYQIKNSSKNAAVSLNVFTANLLQENDAYDNLIKEVNAVNADILLLTEVNEEWYGKLNSTLALQYKYQVAHPLDNTYGILLYSKFPTYDAKVEFLVSDSIPSIHTKIIVNTQDTLQLYGIHPTPPLPRENPLSTNRDSELMQIALLSQRRIRPVIVLGDFNDVAWSQTSKLFHNVSELLDIRIGRGLYNTYSAKSWILRWPLDHIFVSEEFRVKRLKSGSNISSDHFPFYAELTLEPKTSKAQRANSATAANIKLAKQLIKKENRR